MTNPHEWHLEAGPDGWYVVDEYGTELGWASRDYTTAKKHLDEMIREEIAAQEENGPGPDQDPMRGVEFPFAENH